MKNLETVWTAYASQVEEGPCKKTIYAKRIPMQKGISPIVFEVTVSLLG